MVGAIVTAAPPDADLTCLLPVWAGDSAGAFSEAVDSLRRQTRPAGEIILCQDGELPPALEAAVRTAESTGPRRVRNPGPMGLHHNLNHALDAVRTAYVARADADDLNLPRRFELQMRFLRENPQIAALGGAIVEFWPDGRSRRKSMPLTH
ncbi:MAG: glycosyltransferase, partial [Caulobacteraceae bacterium]|nr:glycosyltransferase [Caulobacteraceae bacterium]